MHNSIITNIPKSFKQHLAIHYAIYTVREIVNSHDRIVIVQKINNIAASIYKLAILTF